jgi:two-component system cell cycle response regulator DivK
MSLPHGSYALLDQPFPVNDATLSDSERDPLVLVVDDDQGLRDLFAFVLRTEGYRVTRAGDGVEALSKAKYLTPDVIVLDLCLPRLDGWSVIRHLKSHPDTGRVPILALTGYGTETDAGKRARQAGCDAFFAKPLTPKELVRAIRAMVRRRWKS